MAGSISEKDQPEGVEHVSNTPPQSSIDATNEKTMSPSETELSVSSDGPGEARMTKAKWLACIALGLGYTTAFQQHACTATIMRHINKEIGGSQRAERPGSKLTQLISRPNGSIQLDVDRIHNWFGSSTPAHGRSQRYLWAAIFLYGRMLH